MRRVPLYLKLPFCAGLLVLLLYAAVKPLSAAELPGAPGLSRPPLIEIASIEIASTDEMIGQMIMAGFRGADITEPTADLTAMLEHIRQGRVGGVILFDYDVSSRTYGRNITGPEQLTALTTALRQAAEGRPPLFIAVDQEGGKVQRLKASNGFSSYPSAAELGRGTPEATLDSAYRLGLDLARYGINVNFAPCVDVAHTASSPAIGDLGRSFGPDAQQVAAHSRAFAEGLARAGVIPVYKHFPGHGSAAADSHDGLPDITATYKGEELLPYRDAPDVAGMVMVGHLYHQHLDLVLPASLSPTVITQLLRNGFHWDGVVITDDLQMKALTENGISNTLPDTILLAINAGTDILLFGNNLDYDPELVDYVTEIMRVMVEKGEISQERLRQSYDRIMLLKEQLQ